MTTPKLEGRLLKIEAKLSIVEAYTLQNVEHCKFLREGQQQLSETANTIAGFISEIKGRNLHVTVKELEDRVVALETIRWKLAGAYAAVAVVVGLLGGYIGAHFAK
jgi:hypothetical protein